MAARRKTSNIPIDRLINVIISVVSFMGGGLLVAFTITSSVATKPYVDTKHAEALKYADAVSELAKRDAYDHSDKNRAEITHDTIQKLQDITSKIEAQGAKQEAQGATLSEIKDVVKSVEQRTWEKHK